MENLEEEEESKGEMKKQTKPTQLKPTEHPIPRNLLVTREDLAKRKYFDEVRWFCVSRPQYLRNCGIASLTSVFNFLYSRVGYGELPVVSQEEAMSVLGFKPPFD